MAKNQKTNEVETRKDEKRLTTSDPAQMDGMYVARRLLRTWEERFIDESTGEVVPIERNEIIVDAGKLIDGDVLPRIRFHIEAGDISEVEVSSQRRLAIMYPFQQVHPWCVTASIGEKNRKFLLYATSAQNAMEIAQDYIELNFEGNFWFSQVKKFDDCIFLKDFVTQQSGDDAESIKEFYKIEVEVLVGDAPFPSSHTFVLRTKDVDSGMVVINDWLTKSFRAQQEGKGGEETEFSTTIKSGTVIPCFRIIEKEFSDAYINQDE